MREQTTCDKEFEFAGPRNVLRGSPRAMIVRTTEASDARPEVALLFLGDPYGRGGLVGWSSNGSTGAELRERAADAVKALRAAADALEAALVPVLAADKRQPSCEKCSHCTTLIGGATRCDLGSGAFPDGERCEGFARRT